MTELDDATVRDNPDELRYELLLDGRMVGEILYRREPDRIELVHTEVDPSHEGSGLASRLVEEALRDIRARGLGVVPICPFVAAFIRRHHEYADLVVAPSD